MRTLMLRKGIDPAALPREHIDELVRKEFDDAGLSDAQWLDRKLGVDNGKAEAK